MPEEELNRKCENCEWWDMEGEELPVPGKPNWGRCHVGPAQGIFINTENRTSIDWLHPKMEAGDFCGDFAQRIVGRLPIQIEGGEDAEGN